MVERVDVLTDVRANLSDECLVLLEEVITSNRKLAEENKKLREEHDKNNKTDAEVLKRLSNSWRAKEMLKQEMVLEDVSTVEDHQTFFVFQSW